MAYTGGWVRKLKASAQYALYLKINTLAADVAARNVPLLARVATTEQVTLDPDLKEVATVSFLDDETYEHPLPVTA